MLRAMLRKSWLALLGCSILCATVLAAAGEKGMGEKKRSESWANLPLPRIGIRQEDHAPFGKGKTYIWIRMPQIPFQWGTVHNVFDIHYEEPGGQELFGSRVLEGGVLEVRHRLSKPHLILVSELRVDDYDAIIFIGGSGARQYFDSPVALSIAREAVDKKKVLGAICIAPLVLANAGVLDGVRATGFLSERLRLQRAGARYTGADVERDGLIITASDPRAAGRFGQTIVEALTNR